MSVGKLWCVFMYTVEGMCAAYNTHGKAQTPGEISLTKIVTAEMVIFISSFTLLYCFNFL